MIVISREGFHEVQSQVSSLGVSSEKIAIKFVTAYSQRQSTTKEWALTRTEERKVKTFSGYWSKEKYMITHQGLAPNLSRSKARG